MLRGLNDTRVPGLIAIGSFWVTGVAVGTVAGLSFGWGPSGVWGGLLITLSVAALLPTHRMNRALRRVRDGGNILVVGHINLGAGRRLRYAGDDDPVAT